jgi:hypothetical protein
LRVAGYLRWTLIFIGDNSPLPFLPKLHLYLILVVGT